ncbi:MAG TPA: hypothetical protein VF712_10800 [Thermoleophilaceae bacterium]|jgi:hypothetical protein
MRACSVGCLAVTALAAAVAGCGGSEDEEPPAQPDVYVPDPSRRPVPTRPSPEELECVRPGTGDAGDAQPTRDDPRTLVLRLRDLPKGFSFAVEYQEGGVGPVLLTEVGDELGEAVEAADARRSAARGRFGKGELPPPAAAQPPGAPPPPPSCPNPETEVAAAAVVASSPEGAEGLYDLRVPLAGSTISFGEGPINARDRHSAAPVDVGEEAELIEHESAHRGHTQRLLAWRDGRIVAFVQVRGARGRADIDLLGRLARRQAEYVSAAR